MKIDRHGQAKILTQSEIQLLFSQGLQNERDAVAALSMLSHAGKGGELGVGSWELGVGNPANSNPKT